MDGMSDPTPQTFPKKEGNFLGLRHEQLDSTSASGAIEHKSEKQSSTSLKRKEPETSDSDDNLTEYTILATPNTRDVPPTASQPFLLMEKKKYQTHERNVADYVTHDTLNIPPGNNGKHVSSSIHVDKMNQQQINIVNYRECYISLAQEKARDTCSIRFPLVAKRCTAGDGQSLPLLVKAMQPVLCQRGTIDIHASSEEETIFSVTDDRDAYLAYNMLTEADHVRVEGTIIKFKQWRPIDEMGFDIAEQRISVSISNLPLQLWSPEAVEHILSPYCALEYVSNRTRHRIDLQNYRCIVWAQHRIPIPYSISVCIPVSTPDEGQLMETQPYRRVLIYRIHLGLKHYIHGGVEGADYVPITNVPRYEDGYSTSDAICYMPPNLVNKEFMQELSNSIIVPCTPTYAKNICAELRLIHPAMDLNVKTISQTQQIILLPAGPEGNSVQQKILTTPLLNIPKVRPWSPATGSTEHTLHVCARILVQRVPAHYCTKNLMHLFLGGYAFMEIPDNSTEKLINCETYRCIIWCHNAANIPQNLLAKVISTDIASTSLIHPDPDVTLRTSKILIEIQHTASSIQDLLNM